MVLISHFLLFFFLSERDWHILRNISHLVGREQFLIIDWKMLFKQKVGYKVSFNKWYLLKTEEEGTLPYL